jgi:YfiH family protein
MATTSDPRPSHGPIPSHLQLLQHPQWSRLPWLAHAFSTRTGGLSTVYRQDGLGELNLGFTPADDRETVMQNRQLLLRELDGTRESGARLTALSQIHSPVVHTVHGLEEIQPGDGMVTATPGVYLAIQTADCVPMLLVDEKRRVVAAVHAGWRGTVKRIVEGAVEKMRQDFASGPGDISVLIGPSIDPCCYAVGEEVHQEFAAAFPYAEELFRTEGSGAERKLRLDLVAANRRQCIECGVEPHNIHRVGGCTSCNQEQYFSHRRSGGNTGRMMSVVGIRK